MRAQLSAGNPVMDQMACLAHGARLEIICSLAGSPKDVSTLASALELEINMVSHHLRVLRSCGLLRFQRRKQRHVYSLGDGVSAYMRGEMLHLHVDRGNDEQLTVQARIGRALPNAGVAS